jgi:2-keto-4-pentenoate hydratase/2-oxohepta-3-ene-1,7-dioic acid hydratase in catechol pathway
MMVAVLPAHAATEQPVETFKFGTFEIGGKPKLGLVLRDQFVVELKAANRDLERGREVVRLPMAKDMKELAGRYHLGLNNRIYKIVNYLAGKNLSEASDRPWYVHEVGEVRTLAPILYPNKILNAAGNYYGHISESLPREEQRKIAEERRKNRGIPYLFHKSTTNAVIGDGDPIIMPRGRPNLDWECELGVVIGQPAQHVTAARAKDHIFGYTIEIDVSSRGGRGDERFGGSDWLMGKGHDTHAPLGPYVVPAEFIKDPMDLGQKLTVNGTAMQDARSTDMIHNIYELIEYGSSILTLESGDVVAAGSPSGTAGSRVARDAPVPYLKPGDVVVASIEGIGSLTHTVVADTEAPTTEFTAVPASEELAETFKFGTFEFDGRPTLGVVLRDRFVVELKAANHDLERSPQFVEIPMPKDMKELAGRYQLGLNNRIYQIVNYLTGENLLEGGDRPRYVHEVGGVRTLAAILYPNKVLNAAGNYYGHVGESGTPEEQRKAAEARRKERGIPYLFIKSRTNAVIGDGDPIIMPKGRPKLDWECELAAVIGQPARYVTAAQAKNHVFGYTIEIDVSDRGGRGEDQPRSDWLMGKGHDTFAPMGPFVVPAEFIKDPMDLGQRLTVNGKVMQDAHSSDMIHNVYELIEYGSSIVTLEPGDVIAGGSPAGTGMSRSVRPEQIWLKVGDEVVATIEGIGSLTHKVKAFEATQAPTPTTTTSSR